MAQDHIRRRGREDAAQEYQQRLDGAVARLQAALNSYGVNYAADFRMHREQMALAQAATLASAIAAMTEATEPLRRGFWGRLRFLVRGR